jgi:DNA-binding transcriptional regulator PaaX
MVTFQKIIRIGCSPKKGTAYRKQALLYSYIPSPFSPSVKNKLIISFDVPESRRIDRNWLRNQIRIFGYTMLQQSLWIGPGPLPKEFKERLSTLKLDALVKVFSLTTKL